jgi:protein-tyrosine kinase
MRKRRGGGDTTPTDERKLHGESSVERAMSRFRDAAEVDTADEVHPLAPPSLGGQVSAPSQATGSGGAVADATDVAPAPTDQSEAADAGQPAGVDSERQGKLSEVIDLSIDQLRESGLWPAEAETRRIGDQYRRIKRPLLANAFGVNTTRLENGNLIMVASSLSGEGKSFTSFNLATSIAHELDRTVLLVDADVAKPHITRSLGLHERPGLIDLLLDPSLDLQDVILKTSISGMRLLPAGPLHQHATELLASERMATLVKELSSRYPDRVIIFDTPPLLLTTEAQAMAHLMGQIVVVVHAAHTPQSAVLQALESLEGTTSISIVLNKTRTAMGEEYGGYGYY